MLSDSLLELYRLATTTALSAKAISSAFLIFVQKFLFPKFALLLAFIYPRVNDSSFISILSLLSSLTVYYLSSAVLCVYFALFETSPMMIR